MFLSLLDPVASSNGMKQLKVGRGRAVQDAVTKVTTLVAWAQHLAEMIHINSKALPWLVRSFCTSITKEFFVFLSLYFTIMISVLKRTNRNENF